MGIRLTENIVWSDLTRGCPQGSCIGPLLWLIIADKILKQFKMTDVNNINLIISYADDFIILLKGNTRVELELDANRKIGNFTDICNNLNLTISIDKRRP